MIDYLTGKDFAERYGVTLTFTGPDTTKDESGWEHYVYEVKLTHLDPASGPVSIVVPWRQGLALTDDPQVSEVLTNLAMTYRDSSLDWDDYADEYGLDSDSRREYAGWEAAQQLHRKITAWCSSEAMRKDFTDIYDS